MGIGLKNESWENVVRANKAEEAKRLKSGQRPRFPEPEQFMGVAKTTPEFEKFLAANHTKMQDERALPSTARGKRRKHG